MSGSKRAKSIEKLHKALKKHYEVPPSQPSRPLMEHILYASLLEDCPADLADEGMAKCEQDFFDWNEVRITTVSELSQVLSRLPDPKRAASRLKGNLQAIFEEFYTFDLDHLKKENLGKAVKKFSDMPRMTSFVLHHTVQHGLGGHAIPLDYSAMVVMLVTGVVTSAEAGTGKVPGLERAIPKNKGIEFAGLLHQCAVALNADSQDKVGRQVLEAVSKGASKDFDEWLINKKETRKRVSARKAKEKTAAKEKAQADAQAARESAVVAAAKKAAASSKRAAVKKAAVPSAAEQAASEQAAAAKKAAKLAAKTKSKKPAAKPKAAAKPTAAKKTPVKPKAVAKKSTPNAKAKTDKSKKTSVPAKKAAEKSTASKKAAKKTSKKSTARKLSQRKPR